MFIFIFIKMRKQHSMKVVALCNKLSRSRSAKLRGDGTIDVELNGGIGGNSNLGILANEVVGRTSPGVSNMTTGREAVEVRHQMIEFGIFIAPLYLI